METSSGSDEDFVFFMALETTLIVDTYQVESFHFACRLTVMSPRESERIIAELRSWCDEKYGRRVVIAKMLGRSPQLVSAWLTGDRTPTLDDGLKLQAFLRNERRRGSGPKN